MSTDDARTDRLGEELANQSNIWPVYVASAAERDAEIVDGWNKSLDVLLLFVGLSCLKPGFLPN